MIANRANIALYNGETRKCQVIEVFIPNDSKVPLKEGLQKSAVTKLWNVKSEENIKTLTTPVIRSFQLIKLETSVKDIQKHTEDILPQHWAHLS